MTAAQFPQLIEHLTAALRTRASSPQELSAFLDQDLESTRAQIKLLEDLGFLSLTNDVITYRRPDVAVANVTAHVLNSFAAQTQATLQEANRVLESLPGLSQAWNAGSTDEHSLHIDVVHGPWAPADMWRLQFTRRVPEVTDVCMPDTSALFSVQQEYQASFWEGRAGSPIKVRLLMSVADATNAAGLERIQGELAAGVEIRMHPNPPSFFWITDHDTIGIPLEWGQTWPSSVLAIQSPALAAVMTWIYERVWQEAVPVLEAGNAWDGMLRLMSQGTTMESAANSLGLTHRTGRRRVADAMAHYGATSHFSLGIAWGRHSR